MTELARVTVQAGWQEWQGIWSDDGQLTPLMLGPANLPFCSALPGADLHALS